MSSFRRVVRDRSPSPCRLRSRKAAVAFDLQTLEARRLLAADVVINEIMHHAPSHDPREEYVELYNRGDAPADLTGWRFDQGVTYAFTGGTLGAGGYLVVAADAVRFAAKYPGVSNVVGNWTGRLSNNRESIRVVDAAGDTVDRVEYAESGDWALRRRGPVHFGHQGWEWEQAADGGGPSLELVNAGLTNDTGQNWSSSTAPAGTPGRANSIASNDVAPLIRDVAHSPAIPRSSEAVTITARINDELGAPASVMLFHRVDSMSPPAFSSLVMRDNGTSGDAVAGDGTYTAVLPARSDKSVVEYYVRAVDAGGNARTWPAPTDASGTQGANALYQVDDTTYSGNLPIYRIIMTEAERAELVDIGNGGPNGDHNSNAQMNATFIAVDGTGTDVRYVTGVRNRGNGSRLGPPNNYRVAFAADREWDGVTAVIFNAYYVHSQLLGSAVYRLAGIEAPDAAAAQVRVNGANLAEPGGPRMFGSYVMKEEVDSDFADEHFPGDGGGNYYGAFRTNGNPQIEADLRYEGTNPDAYRDRYFKQTNKSEDDWSDLIRLVDVLNNAPEATFLQAVSEVIDVRQWMRYLALDSLMLDREGGLDTGVGDDFGLYRGQADTRFKLVPHDLDTLFNQGVSSGAINQSIFTFVGGREGTGGVDGLRRLLTNPQTVGLFYQAFVDVIRDTFNPTVLNPIIDRFLGPFIPAANIAAMKQFVIDRSQGVLAQIPREFTVSSSLPLSGPYHRTASPAAQLTGTADAVTTRSVTVNGQVAGYNATEGTWALGSTTGAPVTLVPTGATWRFQGNGADLGTAWQALNYSEAGWGQGAAQLGWGDGDERTPISQTPTRVTTYFRLKFNVADPSQFAALNFRLLRDDGAVVWLNGTKAVSSNMPSAVAFDTRPTATVANSDESRFYPYSISPSSLVAGENILAVEVHDASGSTDLSFDLGLEAVRRGAGSGNGVALNPGVNRLTVQAFDGPNGTGNVVNSGFVDVWYDAPGGGTSTAPVDDVGILMPDAYRPGTPVLVQVQAQYNGQIQRELWDAVATLSVNRPDVFLSTSEITLRNGLGSALVTLTGPGITSGASFSITASVGTRQVSKPMTSLRLVPVTNVSGALSGGATTWSGVIHVTGDVIVPAGHVLTIQPGTLVLLNGVASGDAGTDIQVNGTIRSLGTSDDPVTFTAWDPTLPWGELRHASAQPSVYQYTLISRAGNSPGGGHTGKGPVIRPNNSTITFDHVAITDNVGKIAQATGSNLTFTNSELSRSIAGAEIGSTQLLQDWTWTLDMRGTDDNDGIYLNAQSGGQTLILRRNVFAGIDDDGIDTLGSTVTIDDTIVRDSKDKGLSTLGGVVTVLNSLFVDNTLAPEDGTSATISAKPGQGHATATVNMDHVTVVAPVVGIEGRDKFGEPTLRVIFNVTNSIIRAADAVRTDYNAADIHISYSNVSEAWAGSGNINADPLFTNPAAHDFHLRPTSPSLNAGDPASPNDLDGTRADQGYWRTGPREVVGGGGIIGAGTLPAGTTVLSPQYAYRVTGDVVVPAGSTLQVLPGTTLFFDPGAGITVQGGRLIAEGNRFNEIRFTLYPGAVGTWDGLQFLNTMQDNRLTWAVIEYGGTTANNGMVGLTNSKLLIDHAWFDHTDRRRIRAENSSLIVRNSEFADFFPGNQAPTLDNLSEHIYGRGIAAGGQLVIENNIFGATKGYNDAVDLAGGQRPGPIPQILNNLFKGGGDDGLDLDTDAHIEGNTFLRFRKDQWNTAAGEGGAISAGGGRDYTVVRNVFFDVDHAARLKDGAFLTFVNNTVVNPALAAIAFDAASPGRGADVDSSIFFGGATAFGGVLPVTQLTVNRSVVPAADVSRGIGNTSEDARVRDPANLDFTLRPGSPGLGAGANGLDMGARVPAGVSLTGVPAGTTGRTGATIVVGGPGVTHYRYRLDNGAWSDETPVSTPIGLSGLANGAHTLQVVAKNSAGAWQPDAAAATRTWTVNTAAPAVKINELLAINTGGVDLIELWNDSDDPISLTGMSITDDPAVPRKFVFTTGTIGPGEYLILHGDNRAGTGVRFNLRGGGEGVWLYDTTGRGGALLDSVVFGPQVPDLSIGRGAGGAWGLTRPSFGSENLAQRTGDPSTLRLNEWLTDGITPDFVELYNPDALPVPLAGLSLTDHIGGAPSRSPMAPLAFVPARGWLYFTADGDQDEGADHANFQLASDGGQLALIDAATGKAIDRVVYGPQRTGISQGLTPDGGAGVSTFNTPTPGASNLQGPPSNLTLRITEIMYHPVDPQPGSEYEDKDFEFLELQNTGTTQISLSGVKLTVGVTFVFPDMTLQPGQYVVIVENRAAFESRYGTGRPVIGVYDGDLDDSGERLRLEDGSGARINDFAYGDNDWYPLTDGAGYSLVVNNPQAPEASWGLQQSWHAGNTPGGTPGAADGVPVAAVLGRRVFYNNSSFDGNTPAVTSRDDSAVATDKFALLPGNAATFANYTSYSRGLNGIFIDFLNFIGAPALGDFVFRTGNAGDPSTWTLAPNPAISVRPGAGVGGSSRLALVWADGAIRSAWVQVTVKPGGNTGLGSADVFYFGNFIGDVGDSPRGAAVNVVDITAVRRNVSGRSVDVENRYDFNRDGKVNNLDVLIARASETRTAQPLITAPPPAPAGVAGSGVFGNTRIAPRRRATDLL